LTSCSSHSDRNRSTGSDERGRRVEAQITIPNRAYRKFSRTARLDSRPMVGVRVPQKPVLRAHIRFSQGAQRPSNPCCPGGADDQGASPRGGARRSSLMTKQEAECAAGSCWARRSMARFGDAPAPETVPTRIQRKLEMPRQMRVRNRSFARFSQKCLCARELARLNKPDSPAESVRWQLCGVGSGLCSLSAHRTSLQIDSHHPAYTSSERQAGRPVRPAEWRTRCRGVREFHNRKQ
jgi:hypothetical protein